MTSEPQGQGQAAQGQPRAFFSENEPTSYEANNVAVTSNEDEDEDEEVRVLF
jgi:hypothetical protein